MNLVLFDRQLKYTDDFLNFLIPKMIYRGLGEYNPKKTVLQEVYINEFYKSKFRKYIAAKDVIISGFYNLTWQRYADKIVIEIDPNCLLVGTTAKLNEVCKLINYGTLEISAYPIFTEVFNYFKENIDRWYDYYGSGGA